MRLELSGSFVNTAPVVLVFDLDQTFVPADYIDLGYTNFDLICIGGAGGSGGGIVSGTYIRNYGGAGGGGGAHRVQGLLSGLPSSCSIIVGDGGAAGANHVSNPALTTSGGDGGYSSFQSVICRASGGKGGIRAQSHSDTVTTDADGGQGGIGDSLTAGGGGVGGTAGTPTSTGPGTPGTNGSDGTWDGSIGGGGGGGAGGVALYDGTMCNPATSGGKGAFNVSDPSAYAAGGSPSTDPDTLVPQIVPGLGGGAKAALVSASPKVYGSSKSVGAGNSGIVIIRLTAE